MIAAKSAGEAGGAASVDDGPIPEEDGAGAGGGTGGGDGAVDVATCDMLGGGDRTLLVDCDGS